MDLYRVVTATGDISKPVALESAKEFLKHALSDFEKFENTQHDKLIKTNLEKLYAEINIVFDSSHRLRWAENVLTNRCRIY